VTTDQAGSVPITSPGYFRYDAFDLQVIPNGGSYKVSIPSGESCVEVPFEIRLTNKGASPIKVSVVDLIGSVTTGVQTVYEIVATVVNAFTTIFDWVTKLFSAGHYSTVSIVAENAKSVVILNDSAVEIVNFDGSKSMIINLANPKTGALSYSSTGGWGIFYASGKAGNKIFASDGTPNGTVIQATPDPLWITIPEDICGSTLYDDIGLPTYPYKSSLPTPDFKVNVKDVAGAAAAFGAKPGGAKWWSVADINGDYVVDARDVARICSKFGWK
jgi:hypothetical protein